MKQIISVGVHHGMGSQPSGTRVPKCGRCRRQVATYRVCVKDPIPAPGRQQLRKATRSKHPELWPYYYDIVQTKSRSGSSTSFVRFVSCDQCVSPDVVCLFVRYPWGWKESIRVPSTYEVIHVREDSHSRIR